MLALTLAAAGFAALHLLVSGTSLRDGLVARLGEKAYAGLFSLASAVLLGWMIWAFVHARVLAITPFYDQRWIAAIGVFMAVLLVVPGLTTPAATGVGGASLLQKPDAVRGIHRITRHPFLWGVATWALVHLAFNIGTAERIFFGTFLLVAVAGTFSIDAKRARRYGESWSAYAQRTSNFPFVAIAQGRNTLALGEIGLWRLAAVFVVFLVALKFHAQAFGLPAW